MLPPDRMTALRAKILNECEVGLQGLICAPFGRDMPEPEWLLDVHLPKDAFAQASART